jgi:hypothetical protein
MSVCNHCGSMSIHACIHIHTNIHTGPARPQLAISIHVCIHIHTHTQGPLDRNWFYLYMYAYTYTHTQGPLDRSWREVKDWLRQFSDNAEEDEQTLLGPQGGNMSETERLQAAEKALERERARAEAIQKELGRLQVCM